MTSSGAQQRGVVYQFDTPAYHIQMTMVFQPLYKGRRLVFYGSAEPGKELCYSESGASPSCVEHFVGAVAAISYHFQPRRRDVPPAATFREVVKLLSQAPGLPDRPPYLYEQRLVRGMGSDLQAFGYDESGVSEPERQRLRSEWRGLWRVYRQELFVNGEREPFAVVEWRHTLEHIEVIRTMSTPPATPGG